MVSHQEEREALLRNCWCLEWKRRGREGATKQVVVWEQEGEINFSLE